MSKLKHDLYKLSELAKLYIEDEHDSILSNINNILSLINKLKEVDLSTTEPMFYPTELAEQTLREDLVTEPNLREILQQSADPQRIESGLYLVPKVIE